MAIIVQFQTDPLLIELLERHHAWHTPGGAHGFPSRQYPAGTPNSGREFFNFHHDMVRQFLAWNTINNAVPAAQVAAWNGVPAALKVAATGWPIVNGVNLADAETRAATNNPAFVDDDDMGIFVEATIHNWIHGAVALIYNDPVIGQFHSPQSTYFYQIHGMIDMWWNQFLHPKTRIKDLIDNVGKVHIKEFIKDHKEFKENKEFKEGKEIKEFKEGKEFKEKDKDLIENFDPRERIDPEILKLQARIQSLELQMKRGAPFIKPDERPEVGGRPAPKKRS